MTEPAEQLTPGVQIRPAPCFTIIVVGSDDGPDFEGGYSHYDTEADAADAVTQMQADQDDDDRRELEIRPESFCCIQAVSLCGILYVYEGDADTSHFVDRQNLTDCMDAHAYNPVCWQITPEGAVLCDDAACRTCWLAPDADPLTIPVRPVAGQIELDWSQTAAGLADRTASAHSARLDEQAPLHRSRRQHRVSRDEFRGRFGNHPPPPHE